MNSFMPYPIKKKEKEKIEFMYAEMVVRLVGR